MSRKGNGWDHAPTASGFNRVKNERSVGARFLTREARKAPTVEDIEVFDNPQRPR